MKLERPKSWWRKTIAKEQDCEVGAGSLKPSMDDPYLDESFCVERLFNEYKQHKKLVVAVDFDDTFFDYHKKGYSYPVVIELIKECQELGFYIVLFTGCAKDKWPGMIEYCKSIGITPAAVNQNPIPLPFGNDGKIYFNILFDDRAGLWEACCIMRAFLNEIKLS